MSVLLLSALLLLLLTPGLLLLFYRPVLLLFLLLPLLALGLLLSLLLLLLTLGLRLLFCGLVLLFLFGLSLLLFRGLSLFLLCVQGRNGSEKKEQGSRAHKFNCFHKCCLLYRHSMHRSLVPSGMLVVPIQLANHH